MQMTYKHSPSLAIRVYVSFGEAATSTVRNFLAGKTALSLFVANK